MQIAKIQHHRCDEYAATTYVWVDDAMTADQLEEFVEQAKKSYLAAEEAFKNDPDQPPLPNWANKYSRWPDKTVKEAEALFAEQENRRKAWEQKRNAARQSFRTHLITVAAGRIVDFYDADYALEVDCSWGHRHGTTIDMGDSNPHSADLAGSEPYPES